MRISSAPAARGVAGSGLMARPPSARIAMTEQSVAARIPDWDRLRPTSDAGTARLKMFNPSASIQVSSLRRKLKMMRRRPARRTT